MAGASLYTFQNPLWTYNRNESLQTTSDLNEFDVLVTHSPEHYHIIFDPVEAISAYSGLNIAPQPLQKLRQLTLPIGIRWQKLVYLVHRRVNSDSIIHQK